MSQQSTKMNTNRENNINNPPNANEAVIEKVIKAVLFLVVTATLTRLVIVKYNSDDETTETIVNNELEIGNDVTEENIISLNESEILEQPEVKEVEKVIIKQPSCPKSYLLVILEEICSELVVKKELCTPEDFYDQSKHKVPRRGAKNDSPKEPKVPAIINYAVGGLLITSVGAALVELYKAKKQAPKKDSKHPLSRKCSLADLTVLKHHRKELIRRESIMEVPEEGGHLKQLGFVAPPLNRRCSFPVGPVINSLNNYEIIDRRTSLIDPTRRFSIIDSRRPSIIDDRRQSILMDDRRSSLDYRNVPTDGRKFSIDDSPERRYHRLVHRH